MSRLPRSPWRHAWLPIAALTGLVFAWIGSHVGAFDPDGQQFGANWPGELLDTVQLMAIEIAVLYLVLRPWSYAQSWGRALVAGILLAAYGAFAFAITFMHGSAIALMHLIWLALLGAGLFVATVISASAAVSKPGQSPA